MCVCTLSPETEVPEGSKDFKVWRSKEGNRLPKEGHFSGEIYLSQINGLIDVHLLGFGLRVGNEVKRRLVDDVKMTLSLPGFQ